MRLFTYQSCVFMSSAILLRHYHFGFTLAQTIGTELEHRSMEGENQKKLLRVKQDLNRYLLWSILTVTRCPQPREALKSFPACTGKTLPELQQEQTCTE